MNATRPTKKQRELLSFLEAFIMQHGYGPSYREIMSALGYKSVSTVAIHIDNLIKRGHLRKRDNSARSLEVIKQPPSETSTIAPQEQWLIDLIDHRFTALSNVSEGAHKQQLDELKILMRALHLLGLEAAAAACEDRLQPVPA